MKPGDQYSELTAIKFIRKNEVSQEIWLFKCSCGYESEKWAHHVKRGVTKSCGFGRNHFSKPDKSNPRPILPIPIIARIGNKSRKFESIYRAAKWLNLDYKNLRKHINGEVKRDHYRGYTFSKIRKVK